MMTMCVGLYSYEFLSVIKSQLYVRVFNHISMSILDTLNQKNE